MASLQEYIAFHPHLQTAAPDGENAAGAAELLTILTRISPSSVHLILSHVELVVSTDDIVDVREAGGENGMSRALESKEVVIRIRPGAPLRLSAKAGSEFPHEFDSDAASPPPHPRLGANIFDRPVAPASADAGGKLNDGPETHGSEPPNY